MHLIFPQPLAEILEVDRIFFGKTVAAVIAQVTAASHSWRMLNTPYLCSQGAECGW